MLGLVQVSGRSRRRTYWIVNVVASLVLLTAAGVLLEERFSDDLSVTAAAMLGLGVAFALIILVSIRRLHDRNKSGWWMLLYSLVPALFGPSIDGSGPLIPGLPDELNAVLTLLSVGITLWALVDLGFLRGTRGANRFGADPKGNVAAEIFD